MYGKPDPKAIGQYCTVFRINQEYLVTTVVDVVPGTSGVTLGSDWLNNNVSSWNLTSGKVQTYDGAFHTKSEQGVRMIRTSGKKGSNKRKEPDQILMGTPIYAARLRRVAAEARGESIPKLPLEVTQISKVEEYLEYPPIAWSMDYPLELEKYQESTEYLPILPPGSSVGRPLEWDRAVKSDASRTAPASDQARAGSPTQVAPRTASVVSTEPVVANSASRAAPVNNQACAGSPMQIAPRTASVPPTDSESTSPRCELPRASPLVEPSVSRGMATQTSRPQDSKSCKPGASPTRCLPVVAAENLNVQSTRVVGSPVVTRENVTVPDSDPGASSSDSTDSIRTIPDTPTQMIGSPTVPKKRVVKKSWNPNWDIVTYVDDTDQNANANDLYLIHI